MKKLKKLQIVILRGIAMIIYGAALILIGLYSFYWIVKDKVEIYDVINLENFRGEIFRYESINVNPLTLIEYPPKEFNKILNTANKNSILIYNQDYNTVGGVYVEIYIQDSLQYGKFFHVKKAYNDEPGQFNIYYDFQNKIITIKKLPSPIYYILCFFVFMISVVYGVYKIKNNIKYIRDEYKFNKPKDLIDYSNPT